MNLAALAQEFFETSGRLAAAPVAHREGALGLPIAVDDHLRDLLQLRVADSLAERLVTLVHIRTKAGFLEPAPDLLCRPAVVGPDRNDPYLHRREPEREVARVVLDQDAYEPLERAEQCAVD